MINTIFVSAAQLTHLARIAGWQPLPWSPVFPLITEQAMPASEAESLRAKGLLIDQNGHDRINTAVEIALAAVCEPDNQIEIRLPETAPVYLCRAGAMTAGWHGYADGGVAVSFPLTMADRHRLLRDLLGVDSDSSAATGSTPGRRLTATPLEAEIMMEIGERAAAGTAIDAGALVDLVDHDDPGTSAHATTSALAHLAASGLIDNDRGQLSLTGTAEMFSQPLTFGFLVKRTQLPDPAAPAVVDALHVFRGVDRLVVTRQVLVDGEVELECHQANRSQLADMILTLTLGVEELAGIGNH